MAFETLEDLPQEAQQLPSEAQQIFRTAYNAASRDGMSDAGAMEVAWNSVKSEYAQAEDGSWYITKDGEVPDSRRKGVQSGGN